MKRIAWLRGVASVFALALVAGCGEEAPDPSEEADMDRIIEVQSELEMTVLFSLVTDSTTGKTYTRRTRPIEHPEMVRETAREEGLTEHETEILLERIRTSERAPRAPTGRRGER